MNSSHSYGGYDCEFVDVPHEDDSCVICLLPARDPQQTKCECAKLYCKSCYDKLKSTSGTCPTCRQPLDAFPDRNSARRVKNLRVKCTSKGCCWVNELGSLEKHLDRCDFAFIPCPNGCGEQIAKNKLDSHHNEACALRWYKCEYCSSEGTYKEMTGGHLDTCPDLMVPCPNSGCGFTIKRKEIVSHRLECPLETICCSYRDVGCTYTSPRHTMEDHKVTSCGHHLDLAMVELQKLGNLVSKQKCSPCVIKMHQFNQLKSNKLTWCSPGFYTHSGGYKMCIYVYANGHDDGEGTHLSLFLRMMKGENDDTLTWPIRYKCTFTILNQFRNKDHYTIVMNSPKDVHYNSRVLSGERSGDGWGCTRFISHDLLDFNQNPKCQYLKDDSLYFRVKVEGLPVCKPWLTATAI